MAKLDLTKHTHLALAVARDGSHLPSIRVFKLSGFTVIDAPLKRLTEHGETVNIGDDSFYLISPTSIQGKKYGVAAIIRKMITTAPTVQYRDELDGHLDTLNDLLRNRKDIPNEPAV